MTLKDEFPTKWVIIGTISLMILLILTGIVHAVTIIGGTPKERTIIQSLLQKTGTTNTVYRIDLANYNNAYYDGYAWYKARRITLYKQAWTTNNFASVLTHELGHLHCESTKQNRYNYATNEACADHFMEAQA